MTTQGLKAVATGQATAEQARNPYDALKRQLEASKSEFLPLLGQSQANVDRFVRVVLNAVLATPDLLEADRRSLVAACMKAAQDGLVPDGREAVLNIYSTKLKATATQPERWVKMAQYLPMVAGLVKKLYESGEVTSVDAACVYEADKFLFRRGDDPKLEHEPTLDDKPGKVVAVYFVAKLKSGEIKREVMPRRDIEAVRAASKAGSGPWGTWYDQMAIKSVIKRAYKQLPKVDAFEKVADADNEALGFALAGDGVGEMTRAAAAIAQAPAAPALGHSEPDTFDLPAGGEGEVVPVGGAQEGGEQQQAAAAPTPAPAPAPAARGKGKPADQPAEPTYAQRADRILRATSPETAALELDAARDMPADQYDDLVAVYTNKWGKA